MKMALTVPIVQTVFSPRLKEVCEYGYDIGLKDYPIYDEKFRPILNQRIIDHFWLREIGAETIENFIFYLNRTMKENMDWLNPVFQRLADKDYDPFENIDTTTDYKQTGSSDNTSVSNTREQSKVDGNRNTINSNTPQVNLSATDPMDYANNGIWEKTGSNGDTTNDNTSKGSETSLADYIGHTHGQQGQLKFDVLRQWMDEYVNPLNELFDTLEPCFMQLFTDHYNGL